MRMATSGVACAIHSLDFSKPENTRFQYGSSVCLLSIAAPIAGTCEDATPAIILATFRPRPDFRFRFRFGAGLRAADERARRLAPRPTAVALDRAAALDH